MSLIPFEEALSRVTAGAAPPEAETVPLAEAAGRILAADLAARLTQPPFDASAMDGYACRAADAVTAPVSLRLAGLVAAGHPFVGEVGPGESVRIFTGAPVPRGADCVVIQENARAGDGRVEILQPARAGQNVRPEGGDFREGEVLLRAGRRLGARDLTLAAAMNHAALPVRRRPRVAVIATGDELVAPGETPGPGRIVSSVPAGLAAMIQAAGGAPWPLGIARDDMADLRALIAAAGEADILVTIGGASVGEHDLARAALEEAGVRLGFYKIAMRPGKPLIFGTQGRRRALGLPGNPVSALVCGRVFLWPLIQAMLGLSPTLATQPAALAGPLEANGDRTHFMRAAIVGRESGAPLVAALPSQDSSLVAALAQADCLIMRPPHAAAAPAGERAAILPLDF